MVPRYVLMDFGCCVWPKRVIRYIFFQQSLHFDTRHRCFWRNLAFLALKFFENMWV